MAMPRFDGGTSFTTSPSIFNSPPVISSSPAIERSKVDFPQPDGPTKTMNSPDLMSRSMPWRMLRLPYDFLTWFSLTSAMISSSQCLLVPRTRLSVPKNSVDTSEPGAIAAKVDGAIASLCRKSVPRQGLKRALAEIDISRLAAEVEDAGDALIALAAREGDGVAIAFDEVDLALGER